MAGCRVGCNLRFDNRIDLVIMDTEQREFLVDFAETVRRYVCPQKGDKFCSRSELLGKLAQLNALINGKEEIKRPDQTQPV